MGTLYKSGRQVTRERWIAAVASGESLPGAADQVSYSVRCRRLCDALFRSLLDVYPVRLDFLDDTIPETLKAELPDAGAGRLGDDPPVGFVFKVTDARNNVTTYTMDSSGRVTCYQYDALNRQTTVIADRFDSNSTNLQATTTTVYDKAGNVLSTTDPIGHKTSYAYDADQRQTEEIKAYGTSIQQTTTTIYDAAANTLSVTDPRGTVTSYAYDTMNRQTARMLAYGTSAQAITTTLYDLAGNTLSTTDALGNVTSYAYDALNRQTQQIEAYGTGLQRTTSTTYDSAGNRASVTDPRGTVACYQYDTLNRQTTVIADRFDSSSTNLQATTTTVYDKAGKVLSTTDPDGHTTSYAYDALNRQTVGVAAYGTSVAETMTTVYDAGGNILSMTDPRGTVTSYAYDPMNRRTQAIQAYGTSLAATTTTVYDLAGHTLSVTDPLGTVTSYGYDALNRKVTEMDGYGTSIAQTMTTVYDNANNVVQTINAQGGTTTMIYDAQNRQVGVQDPNANITTTVYNALNKIATVDGRGDRTTYGYDALNRQVTVTNALGNVTTTVYDANNNQVTVVDADGNRTTMVYDPLNRETQMTDPLNHSATYAYDLAGNRTSATDRDGNVINSSYDVLNRLTTAIWIQGGVTVNTLTYSYDGDNNQLTTSNSAGTYTMAYNALNQMTSDQEPFGAVLTMTYDAVGDRTQVQDSFGGTTTDTYDALHRLATIQFGGASQTPLRIDMSYTALNQLATMIRYSNLGGTTTVGLSAYSYDAGGRMTSLQQQNGSGSTLENYTYTYDHADRATAEILNGSATTYAYDTTNQLTTVINRSGTTTYSYDVNGNRTMPGYVTGTGNELLNDGTWTYSYDAIGNLTTMSQGPSANTWTYGYANDGKMIWAKESASPGGTVLTLVTYAYDALGNRIEEDVWTQSSGTTSVIRFAYDGQNAWADLTSSNALQTRYIGDGTDVAPIARISAGGTAAWYLTDRQGSVRNLIDNPGTLQDTITYDGFGNVTTESNTSFGDRYKYTGEQVDSATGLQYNRAREYDPNVGRWTTQDPKGFLAGDENLYRYVQNDPTDNVDPTGTLEFRLNAVKHEVALHGKMYFNLSGYGPNPTTYTLDTFASSFLAGVNSVWSSSGWRFYPMTLQAAGPRNIQVIIMRGGPYRRDFTPYEWVISDWNGWVSPVIHISRTLNKSDADFIANVTLGVSGKRDESQIGPPGFFLRQPKTWVDEAAIGTATLVDDGGTTHHQPTPAHEMGHLLGLYDAGGMWKSRNDPGVYGSNQGEWDSLMGFGELFRSGYFLPWHKYLNGLSSKTQWYEADPGWVAQATAGK